MDVDDFVQKWGLDDASRDLLMSLPEEVQGRALERFSPKEHTQNADRLFHGFVKSLRREAKEGELAAAKENPVEEEPEEPDEALDQACVDWCVESNLDQGCVDALLALTSDQRLDTMLRFDPKDGTRNPSGLFMGFCRSVRDGPANSKAKPAAGKGKGKGGGYRGNAAFRRQVALFAETWGLDAICTALLQSQSYDIQCHVLNNFEPKPGTRNVNGLFTGFMKSVSLNGVPPAPAPAKGGGRDRFGGKDGHEQRSKGGRSKGDLPVDREITQFCEQWQLDDECAQALASVGWEHRRQAIEGFDPKPGTRTPSGLFMGFLKSVGTRVQAEMKGQPPRSGRGAQEDAWVVPVRPRAGVTLAGRSQPAVSQKRSPEEDAEPPSEQAVLDLAAKYDLDEQSIEAFVEQEPAVQHQIIETFAPKEGTRDPNRLFMGYIKSVQSSSAKRQRYD